MIFVFDLDSTLLDTVALLRAYAEEVLKPLGVSLDDFSKAIELDRRLRTQNRQTTAAIIFKALRKVSPKRNFPDDSERSFLNYISENAARFFYPDVFETWPALHGKKILLTRGSREIQNAKIMSGEIRGLFEELRIVQESKNEFLAPIAEAHKDNRIIFVDDLPEEHAAALNAAPNLISIQLIRDGIKREPLIHPRCFVIKNLEQLTYLIKQKAWQ